MKNISFAFLNVFLLLIFASGAFAQIQETAKLNSANNQRISDSSTKTRKTPDVFELEKLAFKLVNQERVTNGLKELTWSEDIAKIARLHSQNMAGNMFFSHRGLDGLMVNDRADALGISGWQSIGENIAYNRGSDSPTEFAVESWMQSAPHRKSILSPKWNETAVGIAVAADNSYYFTQVFLLRK